MDIQAYKVWSAKRTMELLRTLTNFEIQDDAVVDQLSPAERYVYESNLRNYRDLKNMIEAAGEAGYRQGLKQTKTECPPT